MSPRRETAPRTDRKIFEKVPEAEIFRLQEIVLKGSDCDGSDIAALRQLCAAGAHLNATSEINIDSLLRLAIQRDLPVSGIEILLEAGGDPGAQMYGFSVYGIANREQSEFLTEFMRRKESTGIWKFCAPDVVTEKRVYADLDYKITQIFNFTAQERTVIIEKISDGHTVGEPQVTPLGSCSKALLEHVVKVAETQGGKLNERDIPFTRLSKRNMDA
jgi:hypothetical protein